VTFLIFIYSMHLYCRLNANDDHIQMVTALALQLIQCVVKLHHPDESSDTPDVGDDTKSKMSSSHNGHKKGSKDVDREVMILTSYETAMRTAHNFLAVFLAK